MRRHSILIAVAALVAGSAAAIQPVHAAPADEQLDLYTVRAPAADAAGFARSGLDVVSLKPAGPPARRPSPRSC